MSLDPRITDLGNKVRLDWTPDLTGQGYRLYIDGLAVSRTFKPEANTTTFQKPDSQPHRYGVQKMDVIGPLEEALWPAPPPTGLPFAEAALRPGFATIKLPNGVSAGSSSGAVNGGEDCLIDLDGITRVAPTTVWTKEDQLIHIKTGRWNGADRKCGLRIRSVDGIGATHVSATDMRANFSIDAFVASGNPGSPATTYTFQLCRTEYPSYNFNDGGEHVDAVQVQGDLKRLEIGLSTFWLAGVLSGGGSSGHPGKGIMLNTISKLPFEVELRKVNFRAGNLLTGAAIFKDYPGIDMVTTEVYFDKQGSSGNQWGTSGAFFPTAIFSGDTASWPASANWSGVVERGLPSGGDFAP